MKAKLGKCSGLKTLGLGKGKLNLCWVAVKKPKLSYYNKDTLIVCAHTEVS